MTNSLPPTFVSNFHNEELVKQVVYRRLGQTDIMASHLAFGGSQVGEVLGTDREQEMIATVHFALKAGINYIDTAPYYGTGNSEIMLGKVLKGVPRQAYYLATKVGRYTRDPATMFNFSSEKTLASVELSLKRMGIDYIDLIQVHDVEFSPNVDIILQETLPTLQSLKDKGVVKHIGITGYSLEKLRQILSLSKIPIDVVLSYSRYTLWDHSLSDYLPAFKEFKVGIIHAAPLGMGLLVPQRPLPAWHPVTEPIVKACDLALEHCKKVNVDLPRLAVHYPFTNPDIDVHLIGMPRVEDVKKNLAMLREGLTEKEKEVSLELRKRYFSELKTTHWEGIEVDQYFTALKKLDQQKGV